VRLVAREDATEQNLGLGLARKDLGDDGAIFSASSTTSFLDSRPVNRVASATVPCVPKSAALSDPNVCAQTAFAPHHISIFELPKKAEAMSPAALCR